MIFERCCRELGFVHLQMKCSLRLPVQIVFLFSSGLRGREVGEGARDAALTGCTGLLSLLKGQEDSSRGSDNSSYDEALSPTSPGPLSVRPGHGERDLGNTITAPPTPELHGINPVFLSSNPSRWSVEEVYEFIASLQGTGSLFSRTRPEFPEVIPQGHLTDLEAAGLLSGSMGAAFLQCRSLISFWVDTITVSAGVFWYLFLF